MSDITYSDKNCPTCGENENEHSICSNGYHIELTINNLKKQIATKDERIKELEKGIEDLKPFLQRSSYANEMYEKINSL